MLLEIMEIDLGIQRLSLRSGRMIIHTLFH